MYRLLNWYFLLLIPLLLLLFFFGKQQKFIPFSSLKLLAKSGYKRTRKHLVERWLTFLALGLMCVALARPQSLNKDVNRSKLGIDIVLALDVSGSMEINDFVPNRLEVAKKVIQGFIKKRVDDRIGLVIFSGTAYTKLPLTIDYTMLERTVADLSVGDVKQQGTAIGMGIAVSLNRLKKSEARSKIVILATDGDNNEGAISPEVAITLAKDMGVRVYTIGVGTTQNRIAVKNRLGQLVGYQQIPPINEELLKAAAKETGAQYYRATNEATLAQIFDTIDKLEKTEINVKQFQQYEELYFYWLIAGLVILLTALLFKEWIFIKIP